MLDPERTPIFRRINVHPVVEPVSIPYEDTELHGFFFRGPSTSRSRPLLILINGSDGSLLDMWAWGGAGALARGYDCLTFDGPGQGYALWNWKQKLYFRPDWEKLVSRLAALVYRSDRSKSQQRGAHRVCLC